MLINLATLTPTMQGALRGLVAEITEHDGISPINESASLGIDGLRDADFFFMGRRSDPHGFVVCDERESTLQVGVHPQHLLTVQRRHTEFRGFLARQAGEMPGGWHRAGGHGRERGHHRRRGLRTAVGGHPQAQCQ